MALLLYSLNVAFDLFYVGLLQLGAKGIPLGLLSSLAVTSWLVFRRNLCDVRGALDRTLGRFSLKVLTGALITALVVWVLHTEVSTPASSEGDFAYLCFLCGAGSLAFLSTLVMTRAFSRPWWLLLGRGPEVPESGPSSIL
jgi:hypothetical protein